MDRPQTGHQVGPVVPGHPAIRRRDVAARARTGRDGGHIGQADLPGESAIVIDDGVETRLRAFDEIHLVHGQHDPADAEQRQQPAVPPRLGQQALARIDQHDGQVRGRGGGDHVARVLLVARGVGQDEAALADVEEAIGDVDGDALLALGGQAVHEKGHIRGTVEIGQGRDLVGRDGSGVEKQAADQGRLAVVDRTAGDQADEFLRSGVGERRHQK